jgi:hypothetical protein
MGVSGALVIFYNMKISTNRTTRYFRTFTIFSPTFIFRITHFTLSYLDLKEQSIILTTEIIINPITITRGKERKPNILCKTAVREVRERELKTETLYIQWQNLFFLGNIYLWQNCPF